VGLVDIHAYVYGYIYVLCLVGGVA